MVGLSDLIDLAPHALVIAIIVFLGFLLGGLVGAVPVIGELGGILEETLQWTGIVTAILFAFRAS